MAIKGFSQQVAIDEDNNLLFVGRPNSFQIQSNVQNREVLGYQWDNPDGILQTVDSFITQETFDFTTGTGSIDRPELSRILNQQVSTSPSVDLPISEKYTIGAGGVTPVAGLILDQAVQVAELSDTDPVQYEQIASGGSPTATQFDVTAGNVNFNASEAGKTVIVSYTKNYTSLKTIGVEDAPLGDLAFIGRIIGPRFGTSPFFYIPRASRISGFALGVEDTSITYRATVKEPFVRPIVLAFDLT